MSVKQIAKGAALVASTNVIRLLVQFVSIPLLARLLSPEDYGLAAMAMPVILFLMMIADAGLGTSLVRTGEPDKPVWHTCFWLSASIGVLIATGLALLSPLIGAVLKEPRIVPLVMTLAAIVPLQTLTLIPGAALQQHSRFGTISLIEIAATVASIASAVVCAVAGLGVWALIWQQLALYSVRLTLTLICSPYRPRFAFDLNEAREHLVFGRNLLGASLISSASRSLENLVIGRVYGPAPVGVYSMAFQFARIPFMLVTGPLQYVLYPYIAAICTDRAKITRLFLLFTRVLALILLPGVVLVAVASEPIFHLLLSPKWSKAAHIFMLIAPATALQPVMGILGTFLMALGRTDVQMRLAGQLASLWFVGLMVSVWFGIEAIAGTYTLCSLLFAFHSLRVCLPHVNCSLTTYAQILLWPITLTVVAALLYQFVRNPVPDHDGINVCTAFALATIAIAVGLFCQRRDILEAFSSQNKVT